MICLDFPEIYFPTRFEDVAGKAAGRPTSGIDIGRKIITNIVQPHRGHGFTGFTSRRFPAKLWLDTAE